MTLEKILITYFLTLNIFTILLCGFDKFRATKNSWRVPEKRLFLLSFIGGSLGTLLGMLLFRHKISKPSFKLVMFLIIIVQVVGVVYFLSRGGN